MSNGLRPAPQSMADEPAMRWWGWGDPNRPPILGQRALSGLRERLGIGNPPRPPVALGRVRLPAPTVSSAALAALREAVGAHSVRSDQAERVCHAAGKGYPDLIRLRSGEPRGAPDAIVYPGSREQLADVLSVCAEHSLAVVPFGGGTSVVGGLEPSTGNHGSAVALDLREMAAVLDLDRTSSIVTAQPGLRVRELERFLAGEGFTLGHFPQSFEYVSLGGCAATRSAGQASTGYGRFEEMVLGIGLTAPAGRIELRPYPASAAGPSVRELIVGSEGTLGVIDELALAVKPAPSERVYEGFFFKSFEQGAQAFREMAQRGLAPDVARLSDEPETRTSLALAGSRGVKTRLGRAYLGARGYANGCLAIVGFEGEQQELERRRAGARTIARGQGGVSLGRSPGEAWLRSRFNAPYMRDELITYGVMVDTLETATRWSQLTSLHVNVTTAIEDSLRACGTPGIVGCHVSHLYETGASLYFTFLAAARAGEEIEQWQAVKAAACLAIVQGGGTITHHHAVGRDHAPWMEHEIGREGIEALRALKAHLDPSSIMNPGKLLP